MDVNEKKQEIDGKAKAVKILPPAGRNQRKTHIPAIWSHESEKLRA